MAFLSELWRRTERASEGVCKLAFFYGGTRAADAPPPCIAVEGALGRGREGAHLLLVCVCVGPNTRHEKYKGRFFPQVGGGMEIFGS